MNRLSGSVNIDRKRNSNRNILRSAFASSISLSMNNKLNGEYSHDKMIDEDELKSKSLE